MNILLVGHRCVGKTTVGVLLARELGRKHADSDELSGVGSAFRMDEFEAGEAAFRERENDAVAEALRADDVVVIAGAGLQQIPSSPLVVWLHRDGWEQSALAQRERLRPQMTWAEEVEWMCASREPRWLAAAHLRVVAPRGRSPERVAHEIATWVRWFESSRSPIAAKTWIVPATAAELGDAVRNVERFGVGGVEVRSDVFASYPQLDVAALASVRTNDEPWIDAAIGSAVAFDVDLAHLDAFVRSGAFGAPARPITLSSHPSDVDPDHITALAGAARRIQIEYPAWGEQLCIKYAPRVRGFADVGLGRAALGPLRRAGIATTYLPQGADFAWARPLLAAENATNYVSARMRADRVGLDSAARTPWDIQDWLPHLIEPQPAVWDALIGDPVEHSQGDFWHRRAAVEANEAAGYVKVRVTTADVEPALSLLAELGVRGLSVTSPLKRRMGFICPNDATYGELLSEDARWAAAKVEAPIQSGNTLVRRDGRWLVTDTDERGMTASLEWLEAREVGPATIALFGGGGVSAALLRAVEDSDWFVVFRCRARDGWPPDAPPFVTLVVNAAGPESTAAEGPPRSRAWLDLHYADVAEPPEEVLHLTGDVFFEAQAEAQRSFWRAE